MAVIRHHRGTTAELHALDPWANGPLTQPELWWLEPVDAAVVLGSRQTPDLLDLERCAQLGLAVVRRRSGGGAVLIEPGNVVWIDLVLPHGVAPDDVRGSMEWAGEIWWRALASLLPGEPAAVHHGALVDTVWSGLVCFAGVGPGEVLVGGRKLVGLSQRRTRHGVRIQGTAYRRAPGVDLASLFAGPIPAGRPAESAYLGEVDPSAVVGEVERAMGP